MTYPAAKLSIQASSQRLSTKAPSSGSQREVTTLAISMATSQESLLAMVERLGLLHLDLNSFKEAPAYSIYLSIKTVAR